MIRIASTLLACALLLCGCTPPVGQAGPPGADVLYAIDQGWHTSIGLPAKEIRGPLAVLTRHFPAARFLTFGFGERQYFLSEHPTLGDTLRALLPSESALLVTALSATPEATFGPRHVVVLHVTAAGVARVEAAISQALETLPGGAPRLLANGPSAASAFYAARGTYDAFDTCNTWTAEMLRIGGLPVSASGVLFASQVVGMARAIAAQQHDS